LHKNFENVSQITPFYGIFQNNFWKDWDLHTKDAAAPSRAIYNANVHGFKEY